MTEPSREELQRAADELRAARMPWACERCEHVSIVDSSDRWPVCPNCGHHQTFERTRRLLAKIGVYL